MNVGDMRELFNKHDSLFLERSKESRADMEAFILLDKLAPGTEDMIVASEHDEIYLAPDPEVVAKNATEADVITLIRCGVRFHDNDDGFSMYV